MIIEPKCSVCHNGTISTMYGGGLDMIPNDSARAYKNLVTQAPKANPKGLTGALAYQCTGKEPLRVTAGDAVHSIMYSKVHDATPICGAPEVQPKVPGGPGGPAVFTPLSAAEQNMIFTWINDGAKNN
jgi:hypothetical protein